ncbi:hypothetical protein [Maridesulfovibrio sp.]|uniref:hypothetical protein n=1 Tax=Maridesulfovibrio sp. TaxID=2795000 RepID=UPI0039EEF66D
MRLGKRLIAGAVIMLLALSGCAYKRPQPNAQIKFEVPSKLSIIKKDSLMRIVSTRDSNRETPGFDRELGARLNKTGYFMVSAKGTPRYLLSLDTFWADRCDSRKDRDYNIRYFTMSKRYDDGSGYEYLAHDFGASYTASLIGTVGIYEVNNMNPLAYFNVAAEDTKWVRAASAGQAKINCDTKGARNKLMAEIIENINGLLAKERRNVPVILPSGGDETAKMLLRTNKAKQAAKRLETVLPPAELMELNPALYEKWDEEAEQAETPKRSMSEDLANYYLFYMTKETRGISEQSAPVIHDGYTRIMLLAEDKSLIDAAADSMARLEETATRLGIKL